MKSSMLANFFLVLALFSSSLLAATPIDDSYPSESEKSPGSELGKYVSVNIEIKELKESGIILKDASQKLSIALEEVSHKVQDLSPEQLKLINALADKVNVMTGQLNQAVNAIPSTIKNAQQPSNELLQQALATVKEETVSPVINTVNRWLIFTIIGLCLLGAGLLAAVFIISKKLATLGNSVVSIAEGYRIIPVEQYQEMNTPETQNKAKLAAPTITKKSEHKK